MTNQQLKLLVNTDQDLITREVPSQRVLEIVIKAPDAASQTSRPPLNLALVLDRSGSMDGEKLEYVKQAALHVLDLLQEQDRIALVAFDDQILLLSPSLPVTTANREELKNRIRPLRAGGSTNLSDGWLAGCQEVAACAAEGTLNRTLLLTDGQANAGIVDLEELAKHSRELSARGISTSTFGVGHGFNEHLLEAMSNQGNGNFYYIEAPSQIAYLFAREFHELAAVTAREVEIVVDIPQYVNAAVLGGWRCMNNARELHIFLGSLYAGRNQEIYVKLLTPPSTGLDQLAFQVRVSAQGEGGESIVAQAEILFQYASQAQSETEPRRQDVLQRFAGVDLAEIAGEALKLERNGENDKASRLLTQSLEGNRPYIDAAKAREYERMSERMKRGMDEGDRKTSHHESYIQKRRRDS
jgi:Ca-activated chloride channel family protein